jgi:hypothetical protein
VMPSCTASHTHDENGRAFMHSVPPPAGAAAHNFIMSKSRRLDGDAIAGIMEVGWLGTAVGGRLCNLLANKNVFNFSFPLHT